MEVLSGVLTSKSAQVHQANTRTHDLGVGAVGLIERLLRAWKRFRQPKERVTIVVTGPFEEYSG